MFIKPFLHGLILNLFFLIASAETDTLYPGQTISYHQTLTSRNGVFKLGDFDDVYLCYTIVIWFNNLPVQTSVWGVSFYEDEQTHDCAYYDYLKLEMSLHGNLILHAYGFYENSHEDLGVIWSSNSSARFNSSKLVLENNGNLVIKSILNPSSSIIWQSFDHPTDTWLPGAKVRFNKLNNQAQAYVSDGHPNFSFEMDPTTLQSITFKKDGSKYGDCKLKGNYFSCSLDLGWYHGEADMLLHDHTNVSYVSNDNEMYLTYIVTNSSILTMFTIDLDRNGMFTQLMWSEDCEAWMPSLLRLSDAYCSHYAVYNHKKDDCTYSHVAEHNCARQMLQCRGGEKEGFLLIRNAILVGANTSQEGSPKECKLACLEDYSCQAYNYDSSNVCVITGNYSGSQLYYRLPTTITFLYRPGSQLYYRLPTTITRKTECGSIAPVIGATIGGTILIVTLVVLIGKCRRMKLFHASTVAEGTSSLVLLKYSDLRRATKKFSRKLGEGGCGSVFKGKWPNSSDGIAVKHLKVHCRGEKQFRAEVSTIGMIHHVNLVRLMGFCAEGTKRFLIYEYMPHGSLDKHIFSHSPVNLDWRTRYQIGLGIAKGLAYLHGECRECIIHCDIKPENILLDDEYNPKIADFGLAKLLDRDFSRVLTTMRGTRGYLAPEWISGSPITSKADVYSYGMMLFEIISGKRNWSIRIDGENDYIPLLVMQTLMSEGEVICFLDSKLEGNANLEEVIRLCRVAGWCIQENEEDRPSMVHVIRILEGTLEVINPPIPRFLQHIAENPDESTTYHSCVDVC